MKPGEYVLADAPVVCNRGREAVELSVTNRGDRPVQVGSHFHFAEANRALDFDRQAALGCRLDIPAGTKGRLPRNQTLRRPFLSSTVVSVPSTYSPATASRSAGSSSALMTDRLSM